MASQPIPQQRRAQILRALSLLVLCAVVLGLIIYSASPREQELAIEESPSALMSVADDVLPRPSTSKAGRKRSAQAAGATDIDRVAATDGEPVPPAKSRSLVADRAAPANPQAALDRLAQAMRLPGLAGAAAPKLAGPTPSLRLSAEVRELTIFRDEDEFLFIGSVENTGAIALERPLLTVTLWNANKTESLGSVSGQTDRAVLGPGARTFFKLMARKLPPFAQVSSSVTLRPCLTDCTHGTLRLVSHKLVMRPPLAILEGRVRNDDNRPLHFAKVIALLRDKRGQARQQSYSFTSSNALRPGETASFSMTFVLSTKPAKIDFDLEGTVADEPGDPSTLP